MVTRRQFGYSLRTELAALDDQLSIDLSFSEGLLESWAAREAFLLFCLLVDPDRPTWRAWFAYRNSDDGRDFKAAARNAGAYLRLLEGANDQITFDTVEALAREPRQQQRGAGGAVLWDRGNRILQLRNDFAIDPQADGAAILENIFAANHWIGDGYEDGAAARLDLELLARKAVAIFSEETDRHPLAPVLDRLREVARRLRQQIATREPLVDEGETDLKWQRCGAQRV